VFKPTAANEGKSFEEFKAINPDIFSWLTVYGTHIDYPVVQGQDNMKYVNTNAEGQYSLSGAIFLDYTCSNDFSDFSSLFYGHHMERSAMFGDIGNFADKDYFDARPYGSLYYNGQEHGLEFFAFVHADAYDSTVFQTNITDRGAQEAYLNRLYELAVNTRDIGGVTADDRIVLLSTCSATSTNGRDILVGKITEEVYDDAFNQEEVSTVKNILTVDGLPNLWMQIPYWARVTLLVIPFPLLILLLVIIESKLLSRKERRENLRGGEQA
jgi:sortase B